MFLRNLPNEAIKLEDSRYLASADGQKTQLDIIGVVSGLVVINNEGYD